MITHLLTRLAIYWLRRHQPAYLAGFLLRSRRPAPPVNADQFWRREIAKIDEGIRRR